MTPKLTEYPMEFSNYQDFWDTKASSPKGAIAAVDGSPSEEVLQHTGRWSAQQVRQALAVTDEDHLLELGCGVGRIGRELAPHCAHWTGTDISPLMLRHAQQRMVGLSNASFHQLSRSSLDMIGDGEIDKAYSIAVFCHMDKEDLYLYLCELHRVLRPGGLIFVETWNLSHPVGWRRWAYEPLVWSRADHSQRKDVARNQFCTPEEFELYASHAGFQVLANYHQSQSVQLIAGKGLDAPAIAAEKARLNSVREAVAYSPLYAEFFGQFVDMLFGTLSAAEMFASLERHAQTPEAILFRPYILSLWQENAEHWGPAPSE